MKNTQSNAAAILALVGPRFGSDRRAQRWYREEPLPGFSGLTAQQLVEVGRGSEVREFLAAVDAGVYA